MVADLDESFIILWRNNPKLNLAKCIFRIKSENSLRNMVIEWGIEANPAKIRTLCDMGPPWNLKEA